MADMDRPRRGSDRIRGKGQEESSAAEVDPTIKGEWSYLVGKVEERKVVGTPRKRLAIGGGKSISELQLPSLKDYEPGELVALHVKAGPLVEYSLAERLGKAGTITAELARHAYSIGNGQIFPPPVQTEVEAIEKEGQGMIDAELNSKKRRSANDADWRKEYKHGQDRIDFRGMKDADGNNVHVMTIDPDSAKDYDDALHARTVTVGGKEYVEVGVHIADVTHFLSAIEGKPGHAMFTEAMLRTLTAYFPNQAYTMLPRILADKLCSLEPDVNRLTLSTVFLIDPDTGKIDDDLTWFGEGVIRSGRRFTYKEAEDLRMADSGKDTKENDLRSGIHLLEKYGEIMQKEREDRKSASFPSNDELEIHFDPKTGKPIAQNKKSYGTNLIVENWMIRANEAFATLVTRTHEAQPDRFPTLLRYHEPPPLADLEGIAERFDLAEIHAEIAEHRRTHKTHTPAIGSTEVPFENLIVDKFIALSSTYELSEAKIQRIREGIESRGETDPTYDADPDKRRENIERALLEWRDIERGWLRQAVFSLFTKARYTTDLGVHFGLSLFPYTHATSPIRRFADVIVHGLVKGAVAGNVDALPEFLRPENVKKVAAHLNAREISIRDASDLAERMWAADFLSDQVGSEMDVYVSRVFRERSTLRRGARMMVIKLELRGGYQMTFQIPESNIKDLPVDTADRNALIGHNLKVQLLGTDPARGLLDLQFISAPEEAMEERLTVEMADFLRDHLLHKIRGLEEEFRTVLDTRKPLNRELQRLKQAIEKQMTARTPSDIADAWAGNLGVLSMRLYRARGRVSPQSAPTPVVPPAAVEPASAPSAPSGELARAAAGIEVERIQRIQRMRDELAAMRRELEELMELKRQRDLARRKK